VRLRFELDGGEDIYVAIDRMLAICRLLQVDAVALISGTSFYIDERERDGKWTGFELWQEHLSKNRSSRRTLRNRSRSCDRETS